MEHGTNTQTNKQKYLVYLCIFTFNTVKYTHPNVYLVIHLDIYIFFSGLYKANY